jgi:hypothetical protein
LREALHYRRDSFMRGLAAAGYDLVSSLDRPGPDDVLVIWNRYSAFETRAQQFECSRAHVIVAENGYLGKDWLGDAWYALAEHQHAGRGKWTVGGPERWDSLGVDLAPWRGDEGETVILGQRGIGSPSVASPATWTAEARRRYGGRVRPHPVLRNALGPVKTLEDDLKQARCVVTWASSAALVALTLGVPVFYGMPDWIGAGSSRPIAEYSFGPRRDDVARLEMFRRLAWAQWRMSEIVSGEAFTHLLRQGEAAAA